MAADTKRVPRHPHALLTGAETRRWIAAWNAAPGQAESDDAHAGRSIHHTPKEKTCLAVLGDWPRRREAWHAATLGRRIQGGVSGWLSTSRFHARERHTARCQGCGAVAGEWSIQGFQIQDGKANRASRVCDVMRATASFGLWANAHFDEVCWPCSSQIRQGGKTDSAVRNLECVPCHSGLIGLAPTRETGRLQGAIGAAPTTFLAHRGAASRNSAKRLPKFAYPTPQLHIRLYAHCPPAPGSTAPGR